jgi:hypothetical protein
MKAPPKSRLRRALVFAAAACLTLPTAHADLPPFLQHVIGASSVEAALFRLMSLPQLQALYPRPPKEARQQLSTLIAQTPADASLYALRARSEEQSLDFALAESDWKFYAAHALPADPAAAELELADFYDRRLQAAPAIAVLTRVAQAPAIPAERFANPAQQRSWRAFERILALEADQALPPNATYEAFLRRYPEQPAVYTRFFRVLLDQKDFVAAQALIPRYHAAFPSDTVFPITAQAFLAYRRGDSNKALSVYERSFDPLWPAALLQNFYALLAQMHQQRAFLAAAHARLAQNPDDLNAIARVFFYYQQQGHLPAAIQALDRFRLSKESRSAPWSPLDLYMIASLTTQTESWQEAARYNYALASTPGTLPNGEPAAQTGLAALIHILLTATAGAEGSAQPLALGEGNLTPYRDIATLDQGPGYWNGILSLWLNGTGPASEYAAESAQAQPYFHRAKAAELLARLDHEFPQAPERAALHAELLRAAARYGDAAPVLAEGKQFLAQFPQSPDRVDVAGLMADAYARQKNSAAEFALYDSLLAELAAKAEGQPLTAAAPSPAPTPALTPAPPPPAPTFPDEPTEPPLSGSPAFDLPQPAPIRASIPAAAEYTQILDRYLARLTATGHLPQALAVLRRELDRSPADPLLYERLATFLQQNNLSAQQEQTYKLAIARFPDAGWQDKLARLYLRERKRQDFAALTRQVTSIFSGTELDAWFAQVQPSNRTLGPNLALQLNLYARKRFPHDLAFTRNLLAAYTAKETANPAAFEATLRAHWWEAPDLRDRFFAHLSQTGKLEAELAQLQPLATHVPTSGVDLFASPSVADGMSEWKGFTPAADPAATRELAEALLWTSHFEQSAPLMDRLSDLYPADPDLGDSAISLFRSLAYLDPTPASTQRAVAIEQRLLAATPNSPDRLATLGDLYAEATSTGGEDLAAAAPFWRRIPSLHPGSPAGSLTSATIFWDYFQFDDALAELTQARTRFHAPTLYGYEAGAIEENRHDLPAAIAEYTAVVTQPPPETYFVDSVHAAVGAFLRPPSDAADSDLQATSRSIFNSTEARARLLRLATRPSTSALVDKASAQPVTAAPDPAALTLRADILVAQRRSAELAPLLEQALIRAQTPEQAAEIGDLARIHSQRPADEAHLQQVTVSLNSGEIVRKGYTPAGSYSLTSVYEHALLRQIALTTDPVEKIQLQFTLARSFEDRKDLPGATKIMAAVYQANPRLLGVVRATVDFYVRTQQPAHAMTTLLEAAKAATPDLADAFTFEAAQKANESGDTTQARALATALLQQSPYDPRYLAAAAQSYARADDQAGLKQFYLVRLELLQDHLRSANLPRDEAKQDAALLRRGLIPALTRLNDFAGATDQYIALLSACPEDAATAQQAELYALQHSREPQLLAFLRTTVHDSPRDSRFAILLAQTEATFGDLPAALAAYTQAIAIRKDRVDLYTARAGLELRLDQPDAATADYDRLYLLTYKDPAWMLRLAELRTRQQRPVDAVKALETAYITGRTPDPRNQFTVARSLDQWNLLPQARAFAEQGIALAGNDLLVVSSPPAVPAPDADTAGEDASSPTESSPNASGAALYARILTRLGQPDRALATLVAARDASASATPSVLASLTQGLSAENATAAGADFAQRRQGAIDQAFTQALTAMGSAANTFYAPEQKLHFAQLLDRQRQADQSAHPLSRNQAQAWISTARAAGLADREADWLSQALLASGQTGENLASYTALQQSRLQFAELAQTLEAYARQLKPQERTPILQQAAQAWRSAGDQSNELRLARTLTRDAATAAANDRFFDLLLRHDPAALNSLASSANANLADAAANYTLAHASESQALAAVNARSAAPDAAKSALWKPAATALVGLYLSSDPTHPQAKLTDAGFRQILAPDASIASRLAHPADPARQLTGSLWFSYGASYGIFRLAVSNSGDAEDLLAAGLEHSPGSPAPYLQLARTYDESSRPDAALAEYGHALELLPGDPALLDEQASLLLRLNRRDAALASWRCALATLQRNAETNAFPESFWNAFANVTDHLHRAGLSAQFRPEIEQILRPYLAHNGNYRSSQLLESAYKSAADDQEGVALILAVSSAATFPDGILEDLRSAAWLPAAAREAILQRRIELARAQPAPGNGPAPVGEDVTRLQLELARLELDQNQLAPVQTLLNSIPEPACAASDATCAANQPDLQALRVELAVRTARLTPLLDPWRAQPDTAPSPPVIQTALSALQRPTRAYKPNPTQIRPLLEFDFDRKRLANTLQPTDFLALAQSRLDTGDLPGALDLLHRLALQPAASPSYATGPYSSQSYPSVDASITPDDLPSLPAADPFANVDSAARLLESSRHLPEAIPFLTTLTRNVPWNAAYRLRLAQAQAASPPEQGSGAQLFLAVAADASAPYFIRVQAAQALAPSHIPASDLGSAELNLLASGSLSPQAVRQPYFTAARIAAASPANPQSASLLPASLLPASLQSASLLQEAIAIDSAGPRSQHARFALLAMELDQAPADPAPLLTLLESLPKSTSLPAQPGGEDSLPSTPQAARLPAEADALPAPERAHLAGQLASAYQRNAEPVTALAFLQLAASLQPGDATLPPRIAQLRLALALDAANAARRPVLHRTLDQAPEGSTPRQIRPRLIASLPARLALPQEAP